MATTAEVFSVIGAVSGCRGDIEKVGNGMPIDSDKTRGL